VRRLIWLAAAVASVSLLACSDKSPMSSMDGDAPVAAGRVVSAPVAGTAENPRGLVNDGPTSFTVTIANVGAAPTYSASGVFNTPVGATGPGVIVEGGAYEFSFHAGAGSRLSLALMYVQSNDLFLAPAAGGIELFDTSGNAISGDITGQIMLWDAGTEVNEAPGTGANQAPRQSAADTGADEGGAVQLVDDGFTYPSVGDLVRVSVSSSGSGGTTLFVVRVENTSAATPFAPGVYVVHADGEPLFSSGVHDRGDGLEALAEDGNPAGLSTALGSMSGTVTVLAPGVWALRSAAANPLFTAGSMDAGNGLEALAEDGNPVDLADAVSLVSGVVASGVFNTPTGAAAPGVVTPGGEYSFVVTARPGDRLFFATMFVQSNDLFYGPGSGGISLFSGGKARTRDVTRQLGLWDAGTEVNQAPGLGADQAPRQAGANTGDDESGVVQLVNDGFSYPGASDVLRVTITPR
jgi:hypothetical protein